MEAMPHFGPGYKRASTAFPINMALLGQIVQRFPDRSAADSIYGFQFSLRRERVMRLQVLILYLLPKTLGKLIVFGHSAKRINAVQSIDLDHEVHC
jgi:hypothetical protein